MKHAPWFLGTALALLVLNGTLALLTLSERATIVQNAVDIAELAVSQGAEHADEVFDRVDRTLSGIAEVLSLQPSVLDAGDLYVHRLLVRRHGITPILRGLFVISPKGRILHTSVLARAAPLDVSDRDYVQYHLEGGSDGLFIGRPIVSRRDGTWVVPVSRRVEDAYGRLIAIVAASFDPDAFIDTLKGVPLPVGTRAAMVAPNGDLLGCLPQADCLGQSAAGWPDIAGATPPRTTKTARDAGFVPGPSGPSAFKVSAAYGITVAMTASMGDVLTLWHNRLPTFLGLGVLGSTGIVTMAFALHRQMRRRHQAMADLAAANATLEQRVAERTTELQRSEQRLRAIIATAHDAIIIIDGRGMILSFNRAATGLFGYEAGEVVGMSVNTLMPDRYRTDHDQYVRNKRPGVSSVGRNQELIALHRDGTEIPVELTVGSTESDGEHIHVGVMRDIRVRKAQEEALWRLAHFDGLTNVLNRRAFLEQGASLVDAARRYGQPLTALMVDADHFKSVNDRFGHHVGDDVLRALAEALRGVMRSCDRLGRLGGEEFAILLPETDAAGAASVAERLLAAIRAERVPVPPGSIGFTVSIGLAPFDGQGDLAGLLRVADHALYQAKAGGRDRCMVADHAELGAVG